MKLGYSITSAISSDVPPNLASENVIHRSTVAGDAGFDFVQAGDHHLVSGPGYLQNIPMTARIAASVDHVAPLFLLPMWNPIIVAEQVGTLATYATVDVWFALGRADQNEIMGIPSEERVPRFLEAVSLIKELWQEDDVTADGRFYPVDGVSVNPKPNDPRIVIGGTAEPAVRRAGRIGDAWVANADVQRQAIAERIDWFEEEGGGEVLARRDALVLSDGDEAKSIAKSLLRSGYRGWPDDADWILVGDAEDVASQLDSLRDHGVDEVVVRPMTDEHADETLNQMAESRDLLQS